MDIALLRRPIEQRLTAVTGLHAKLGRIDVSAFGASLEIGDITLTAPEALGDQPPVVSIARVKVELSLRKAFQGELRIRSIAIEQPIVSIRRDVKGRLALPAKSPRKRADAPPRSSAGDASDPKRSGLSIVIDRAVIVDGETHFRDESATATATGVYHLAATGLTAELARTDDRYDLTILGDHLGRQDASDAAMRERASLGRLRVAVRLDHAHDLAQLDQASLHAEAVVGEESSPTLKADIRSDRLMAKVLQFSLDAATDLSLLSHFAPRPLPAFFRATGGAVKLRARGTLNEGARLTFEELSLSASELTLGS